MAMYFYCSVNAYVVFKAEESALASLAHNMAEVSLPSNKLGGRGERWKNGSSV